MKRIAIALLFAACHAAPPPQPVAKPAAPPVVVDAGAPSAPADVAGVVTFGVIVVTDKGDRETIVGILKDQRTPFRQCYEHAAASEPALNGRVMVRFQIDKTGAVINASADRGSDIENPDLQACLVKAVQKLAFPAGTDGNPVGVIAPVIFIVGVPSSD